MTDLQQTGLAAEKAGVVPVIDTMPADLLTPLAVYLKLTKPGRNSFLLESVEGGANLARYSFIGVDPRMIIRGDQNEVEIVRIMDTERRACGVYDFLRDHFKNKTLSTIDGLP